MSETKKKYEVVQPQIKDYPIDRAAGKMEILDAWTIYKWDGHYWLAVVKVKDSFSDKGPRVSVRGYRWVWKKPYSRAGEAEKPERWMVDLKMNFNKKSQWIEFKNVTDRMFKDLPDE